MANNKGWKKKCICVFVRCAACDCVSYAAVLKCMHACVCFVCARWPGGGGSALWPGDNSDEWPRQVSNEALVTGWERDTLQPRHRFTFFIRGAEGTGLKIKEWMEVHGAARSRHFSQDITWKKGSGGPTQQKHEKAAKKQNKTWHLIYNIH